MLRSIIVSVAALAALITPRSARTQTSIALSAARGATGGAPWLYGAAIGVASHGFGLRISGAAGQGASAVDPLDRQLHWTTDSDVVIAPTRWFGAPRGRSIVPYGFAGAGIQPRLGSESVGYALPHWSWGAGIELPLISSLSLVGEARSRTLFDRAAAGAITPDGRSTEVRAGFAIGFGGRPARRPASPRPASPRTGNARPNTAPRASTPDDSRPTLATVAVPATAAGSALGTRVMPTAQRYLGVRYRYGGSSPTTGFDCSGFVQYVFARHDVELPRTSRLQAVVGVQVEARVAALRPGDLLFFAENGTRVSHVAIYAGDNRVIHATSSGDGVRYDDLSSPRGRWFATRLVSARRITNDPAGIANLARSIQGNAPAPGSASLDPPDKAPPP